MSLTHMCRGRNATCLGSKAYLNQWRHDYFLFFLFSLFAFPRTMGSLMVHPNPTVAPATPAIPGERNRNQHDIGCPGSRAQSLQIPITCITSHPPITSIFISAMIGGSTRLWGSSHHNLIWAGALKPCQMFIVKSYSHKWQCIRKYGQISDITTWMA